MLLHLLQGSATPPMAVTIFFGANDAALLGGTGEKQHVPIEEYKENLRKMVQHIKVLLSTFICAQYSSLIQREHPNLNLCRLL